jgi:hypothetical protein
VDQLEVLDKDAFDLIQADRVIRAIIQLGRPPCRWQAGQGARRLMVRNLLRMLDCTIVL